MTARQLFRALYFFLLALILFFLLSSSSHKQADSLWRWIPTLSKPALEQERLYIQTDKPLYKPGETIWFATHLRATKDFSKNSPSEIVRVHIENPRGQAIFKYRLIAEDGIAAGDFQLNEEAVGGIYRIKAYTQWQLNDSVPEIFFKEIYVQPTVTPRLKMKLKFLREGVGPGDEVLAEIALENNENKPLADHPLDFELIAAGEKLLSGSTLTGKSGVGLIRFRLPEKLEIEDVILQATIPYQGFQESISRSVPLVMDKLDLRFFPEGGGIALDEWHESTIAFKAMNHQGKAVDVKGVIVDRQGNEIIPFESFHRGMGSLKMHIASDQQYFAKITKPAGIDSMYRLPGINAAVSMNLRSINSQVINFTVLSPQQARSVQVVISVRGHAYQRESYSLAKGMNGLRLFTAGLPMGIARVTLQDMKGNGLAERLIFVHYDKQARIEIKTNKEKYVPREKVEVTVSAKNSRGKPISGDFSIAVTDDQLLTHADDHSSNLLSWMLVESELTGKIEKPEFYFDPAEEKAEKALDMLLLTHGWRRFVWREKAPADSANLRAAERKEYRGIVKDAFTRQPIKGLKARLENADEWKAFDTGEFQFAANEHPRQRVCFQAEGYREVCYHLYAYCSELKYFMYKEIPPSYRPDTIRVLPAKSHTDVSVLPPPPPVEEKTPPPPPVAKLIAFNIPEPTPEAPQLQQEAEQRVEEKHADTTPDIPALSEEDEEVDPDDIEMIENNWEADTEPDVNAFLFVSEEPQPLNMELVRRSIGYPEIAREAGIEGQLVVRVLVSESGNYVRHLMIKKVHPILAEAVEAYLPALQFTPAIQNNRPIKFWVNIPFRFKLGGDYMSIGSGNIPLSGLLPVYQTREFAFPDYSEASEQSVKTDFRTTLYWHPHVKLDSAGKGSFSFYTSDAISSYRITAEGFTAAGTPARAEKLFYSQEPLQIDIRMPEALTQGDVLNIPVTLTNRYDYAVSGSLSLRSSQHMLKLETDRILELEAGEAKTVYLSVKANLTGKGEVFLLFNTETGQLTSSHQILIRERGFPVAWSHQEKSNQATLQIPIGDPIDSTLHLSWIGYPNAMSEILEGVKAMLREPYGCFEQTSSVTYPNILVLQLLRNAQRSSPDLERKALAYIQKGYKRLEGFEVGGGGFDWYGKGPAHEVLTAYGLLEFADMKRVWHGVDDAMVQRAVDWLRSRRNGKGGFNHQERVFGTANQYDPLGKDLYVVYSLVEAGFSEGFDREIGYAIQRGLESSHPFLRAMTANILAKQENIPMAKIALEPLVGEAMVNEEMPMGMGGRSLQAGVIALRLLAMLEIGYYSHAELEAVAHQLRHCRTNRGHFGTTQSTVMALRALSKYERAFSQVQPSEGIVSLLVNEKVVAGKTFNLKEDSLIIRGLETFVFSPSDQIKVQIAGLDRPISWSLKASYKAKKPENSSRQKVSLWVGKCPPRLQLGAVAYVEARLKNEEAKRQASTMVRIGIPAGLSPQIWQMKEWIKQERIAFYEWEKGYLTLYFYGMEPLEEILLPLYLKTEVPGNFTALPSTGYLYYTPEFKKWVDPIRVEITP